ncbi:MAG: YjjW family glycine radical enzyme activase [Acidimicrobiia bacterium]|nr:YjjW family glycine radical enzyme activase [Acidimicrobiia bacterium]
MNTGLVARTIGTSVVDGPGNRFVVFMQGCNFNCVNCHNPSTINLCDHCGACVSVCPLHALEEADGVVLFHAEACDGCDRCVEACPTDSTPMALETSVDQILEQLRPRAAFLSGITVSGGEPTLQLPFLVALLEAIKADPELGRLSAFVDSNGSLDTYGWEKLLPWMDGAMIDLKAFTPVTHRRITGQPNERVIDSIRFLNDRDKLIEIRLLVIEGLTDVKDELRLYARFVRQVNPALPVRLMAYRHHGVRPEGLAWPETRPDAIQRVAAALESQGLTNVVLPVEL